MVLRVFSGMTSRPSLGCRGHQNGMSGVQSIGFYCIVFKTSSSFNPLSLQLKGFFMLQGMATSTAWLAPVPQPSKHLEAPTSPKPTVTGAPRSGGADTPASSPAITTGQMRTSTVIGGVLSFFIPGVGQAITNNPGPKVLTHFGIGMALGVLSWIGHAAARKGAATVGAVCLFTGWTLGAGIRFFSAYDAWVDRKGGYWGGKL